MEPWERGLQHLEFAIFRLSMYISAKQTLKRLFPAAPCYGGVWFIQVSWNVLHLLELVYFFLPRTKLLCGEQRGLWLPLFSNPYRPLLQMSRQRSGWGLCGERQRVLKEGGCALSWHCLDVWPQIRSSSALLNYSCWYKCHWKPEVNLLCLLLLSVTLTFPICLYKITTAFENCKYKHYYFVFSWMHINWEWSSRT